MVGILAGFFSGEVISALIKFLIVVIIIGLIVWVVSNSISKFFDWVTESQIKASRQTYEKISQSATVLNMTNLKLNSHTSVLDTTVLLYPGTKVELGYITIKYEFYDYNSKKVYYTVKVGDKVFGFTELFSGIYSSNKIKVIPTVYVDNNTKVDVTLETQLLVGYSEVNVYYKDSKGNQYPVNYNRDYPVLKVHIYTMITKINSKVS